MPSSTDLQTAQFHLATAHTLADISFYASSTQASEAAKLNIRRFSDNGQCKLMSLNTIQCATLAEELNAAIWPVLVKWQKAEVAKALALITPK